MLTNDQRLTAIEAKLGRIDAHLEELVSAQRPMVDLRRELEPIGREMMDASIAQLADLERKGYFELARELLYLVERITEDYSPEDLHELADHAANILDTVRLLTQPSVMAVARDIAQAFEEARDPKPQGLFGAFRRIRKEKHLQRGIGFTLDLLGRLGRGVSRAPRFSRNERKGARSSRLLPPPRRESAGSSSVKAATSPPDGKSAGPVQLAFVADDTWSREYVETIARELGIDELADEHWTLIEFARGDYKKHGMAPNIRRITGQTGISTSQVYQLFPKAPGVTISRLAGIPKPAGCI